MPVNFQFLKPGTKDAFILQDVDKDVCAFFGDDVDEEHYHWGFGLLQLTGTAILMQKEFDDDVTNQQNVEAYLAKHPNVAENAEFFREFFYRCYQFTAWR